jgi:hypothetical protein
MTWLIRKIERQKWPTESTDSLEEISAAAVTSSLAVKGSGISVWFIESIEEIEINRVVLALSMTATKLERMNLMAIGMKDLQSIGVHTIQRDSATALDLINKRHYDIENPNCSQLCALAQIIGRQLTSDKEIVITRERVKSILKKLITNGFDGAREDCFNVEILKSLSS